MLTLYSYPKLFGVADNNPFGLKVYAFLKLCGLAFRHEHIFDASKAPRGQRPSHGFFSNEGDCDGMRPSTPFLLTPGVMDVLQSISA